MEDNNTVKLSVSINTSELDDVTEKVEHLNELLEKASSLINELASREINMSVNVNS